MYFVGYQLDNNRTQVNKWFVFLNHTLQLIADSPPKKVKPPRQLFADTPPKKGGEFFQTRFVYGAGFCVRGCSLVS
jgi:hypothetical protein